jgi:hypothetical protein
MDEIGFYALLLANGKLYASFTTDTYCSNGVLTHIQHLHSGEMEISKNRG